MYVEERCTIREQNSNESFSCSLRIRSIWFICCHCFRHYVDDCAILPNQQIFVRLTNYVRFGVHRVYVCLWPCSECISVCVCASACVLALIECNAESSIIFDFERGSYRSHSIIKSNIQTIKYMYTAYSHTYTL